MVQRAVRIWVANWHVCSIVRFPPGDCTFYCLQFLLGSTRYHDELSLSFESGLIMATPTCFSGDNCSMVFHTAPFRRPIGLHHGRCYVSLSKLDTFHELCGPKLRAPNYAPHRRSECGTWSIYQFDAVRPHSILYVINSQSVRLNPRCKYGYRSSPV